MQGMPQLVYHVSVTYFCALRMRAACRAHYQTFTSSNINSSPGVTVARTVQTTVNSRFALIFLGLCCQIPMWPCERGAGGAQGGNTTLCVDLATQLDWQSGIGVRLYYTAGPST